MYLIRFMHWNTHIFVLVNFNGNMENISCLAYGIWFGPQHIHANTNHTHTYLRAVITEFIQKLMKSEIHKSVTKSQYPLKYG